MTRDHCRKLLLDHGQSRNHLANALAGEILEIASFVNADQMVLHVLSQAMVVIIAQGRCPGSRAVVDRLSRRKNLLGRCFHAFDRGTELAGRACHPPVVTVIDEH